MFFTTSGASRLELAQSDTLTIVGATTSAIDKRRVVPVDFEMLVIDEETLSYGRVTVIKCVNVEPKAQRVSLIQATCTYSSSSGSSWQSLLAIICLASLKIAARFQSDSARRRVESWLSPEASTILLFLIIKYNTVRT